MATIEFFPTTWHVSSSWDNVVVHGRTGEFENAVSINVPWKPYVSIRHDDLNEIDTMIAQTAIQSAERLDGVTRLFAQNRDGLESALTFYQRHGRGVVVDKDQSILSKYFVSAGVMPGQWQLASHVTMSDRSDEFDALSLNSIGMPRDIPLRISFDPATACDEDYLCCYDSCTSMESSLPVIYLERFYQRIYPQLETHDRETIARVLGTTTDVKSMFQESETMRHLCAMSDFWRATPLRVLEADMPTLFQDVVHALSPNVPPRRYHVELPNIEAVPGIYRDVSLYNLSNAYLARLGDSSALARATVDHFSGSLYGAIPFQSGYFDVSTRRLFNGMNPIWSDGVNVVTTRELSQLDLIDYYPLAMYVDNGRLIVDSSGLVFASGLALFSQPTFPLMRKTVQHMAKRVSMGNGMCRMPTSSDIDDYAMCVQVHPEDWMSPSEQLRPLVEQMIRAGESGGEQCVRYVRTIKGDVVKPIYDQDTELFLSELDGSFYLSALHDALSPFFSLEI